MYFLNVNGAEALDSEDILDLSARHKLSAAVVPTGIPPIRVVLAAVPMPSGLFSSADARSEFPAYAK